MAKVSINISTGTLQTKELILGIDLGTTNSLIAMVHPATREAMVLKEVDASTMVPSVIYFPEEGDVVVGHAAKPFLLSHPQQTIYSVKRLIGKSYHDLAEVMEHLSYTLDNEPADKIVHVLVNGKRYNAIELSSFILKELKNRAEHILKMPVSQCVITVPAYFNDAQRQATRDAGQMAGLNVLRIINEPTAASLAYGIGLDKNEQKRIVVYDLGGGTFDVSVLKIEDGIFDVLSTNGDTFLGGDDFDQCIVHHFIQQLHLQPTDTSWDLIKQELRIVAETAKKQLSTANEFHGTIQGKSVHLERNEFETMIKPLVDRTLQCCEQSLKDSGSNTGQIDAIVMVGGSTRIPYIVEQVSAYFGKPVNNTLNPDEVVAIGAAIQADILAGNQQDVLLLDITPLSLGLETMGGLMDVLIPRNSKIPCKAGRQYTTQKDGQSGIQIAVYQGERDLVKDNRKLAEFVLSGIPAMPAGLPKVDIQFAINTDGILHVKARELRSGTEQQIEVKPQYGLTDEEVEERLLDSITHAREDMEIRALTELITEAEQLRSLTTAFLQKHNERILQEEHEQSLHAIQLLEDAIHSKERGRIQEAMDQLNAISRPYAERVMDAAVSDALKGKDIR